MFNGPHGNSSCYGGQPAINFLNGIGIGTQIYVWFDRSGFIHARYEGLVNGVALFTVNGRTIRVPVNNIVAVAT